MECPKDGREIILKLDDYDFSPYDDVPGKYAFELDRPGEVAEATIRYYLNDGFEVKEASKEEPVNFKSPAYKEMIAKSLLSNCLLYTSGIKLASRPKDDNHPYGHKKIEMLAGLFVAIMLVLLSYKTITCLLYTSQRR